MMNQQYKRSFKNGEVTVKAGKIFSERLISSDYRLLSVSRSTEISCTVARATRYNRFWRLLR